MPLLSNIMTLAKNPGMIPPFAAWVMAKAKGAAGGPVVNSAHGVKFGEWLTFSEFWDQRICVPPEECELLSYCRKVAPTPALAIDVGGNVGLFSLTMAALGYEKIHAFEPVPFNYERLEKNLARNERYQHAVKLMKCAAGEAVGTISFLVNSISPGLCRIGDASKAGPNEKCVVVPVTTLDLYCQEQGIDRVDFLKIDVEGHERTVLRGASRMLKEHRIRFMYMESHHSAFEAAGYTAADLYEFLTSFAYIPVEVEDGKPGKEIPRQTYVTVSPGGTSNILWTFKA